MPPPTAPEIELRLRRQAVAAAFLVGLLLMGVKFFAWRITGSSAILSDALESIINVVASAFAAISVFVAAKPPDSSHPYGHGKIEYFSAGFEGALIVLAALGIFISGIQHILRPQPLPQLGLASAIILAASLVNLGLGLQLMRVGRRTRSITLEADGRHVLTDVYTSAGVVAGLALVVLTGWYRLDGLVACGVGLHILYAGFQLIRQSIKGLMDASDPDLLEIIAALIVQARRPDWVDVHKLRAWRSGAAVHVDLHLLLPRNLRLEAAHAEAEFLENLILKRVPGAAGVLVHMDPCTPRLCPICGSSDCGHRRERFLAEVPWSAAKLTAVSDTPDEDKP
jgi:cation diffusion facilitator family transporter